MKHNAVHIDIAVLLSEDGCVFDLGSLYEHFLRLKDERRARGKRYKLALVLVLLVQAKLAEEDQPYGIAKWVGTQQN